MELSYYLYNFFLVYVPISYNHMTCHMFWTIYRLSPVNSLDVAKILDNQQSFRFDKASYNNKNFLSEN